MGNEHGMKPVQLLGWLCMPCRHEKYSVIALARNRQAPGCMCICIRWVSPPVHPLPLQWPAPLRVILFAQTCPQRSRLPIPPKVVCAGSHFRIFLPHHLGTCLHPFLLPVKGLDKWGEPLRNIYVLTNVRECTQVHTYLPPNPGLPLNLDRIFLKACALATRGLCLFCLHRLLQDLFILLSTKV